MTPEIIDNISNFLMFYGRQVPCLNRVMMYTRSVVLDFSAQKEQQKKWKNCKNWSKKIQIFV